MKKILLTFTALSLTAIVAACGMPNDSVDSNQATQHNAEYSEAEHKNHMHMMAQELFNAMDKNKDGVMTGQEYREYTRNWFKSADTNHDGKLSVEEMQAQLKRDRMKMIEEHQAREREGNQDNDKQSNQ